MITPALFILGSGSLIATVLARVGRIVELVRKIGESAKRSRAGLSNMERSLLTTLTRRGDLAEKALMSYYGAVLVFVLTCLLIGIDHLLSHAIYAAPVCSAILGVSLVLIGSGYMVAECRVAMQQLRSEIDEITSMK
jgi:hypothetical protein